MQLFLLISKLGCLTTVYTPPAGISPQTEPSAHIPGLFNLGAWPMILEFDWPLGSESFQIEAAADGLRCQNSRQERFETGEELRK